MSPSPSGPVGIGVALLRAHEITDDYDLLYMAEECAAPVTGHTITPHECYRSPSENASRGKTEHAMAGWCNGAPGIGLGLLPFLATASAPKARESIGAALRSTREYGMGRLDHLCCGNLGRADVLLATAEAFVYPQGTQLATSLAAEVCARAELNGSYYVDPVVEGDSYRPGLFNGLAGIGYEMLRLVDPERFSCVLLFT